MARPIRITMLLLPDPYAPDRAARIPPAGPAVVAGVAEQLGQNVVVEDLYHEMFIHRETSTQWDALSDDDAIAKRLKGEPEPRLEALIDDIVSRVRDRDATVFGISLERHSQGSLAVLVGQELKRRTGLPIIIGGSGAHLAAQTAEHHGAGGLDIVTGAREPDQIAAALKALETIPPGQWNAPIDPIEACGLGFDAYEKKAAPPVAWPIPNYDGYELWRYRVDPVAIDPSYKEHYDGSLGEHLILVHTLADRCQYNCSFCQSQGTQTVRTMDDNIEALRVMSEKYKTPHFFFADTQMNIFAEDFCRRVLDAGLKIKWSNSYRISPTSPEILALMAEAGCVALTYGVESASPAVLKRMRKGHRPEQATEVLRTAHELGIYNRVNLLPCFPGETAEDFEMTRAWVEENGAYIDDLAPSSFYLTLGTPLGKTPEKFGIQIRGARSLSGSNRYRKQPDSLIFDELDGMQWEEREPLLAQSERELREALRNTPGKRDLAPSWMHALAATFPSKTEAREKLQKWGRSSARPDPKPVQRTGVEALSLRWVAAELAPAALVSIPKRDLPRLQSRFNGVELIDEEGESCRAFVHRGDGTRPDLDDPEATGLALGYPSCCVEAWVRSFGDRVPDPFEALATARSASGTGAGHPLLNHAVEPNGLIDHRPCHFRCENSVALAARRLASLHRQQPEVARVLMDRLAVCVVVFPNGDQIEFAGRVRFDDPDRRRILGMVTDKRREILQADRNGPIAGAFQVGSRFLWTEGLLRAQIEGRHREVKAEEGKDALVLSFGTFSRTPETRVPN